MQHANAFIALRAYGDEENPESGTQSTSITDTPEFQEALKSHLAQALERETSGLKNKLSEVLGEKKKTQEQLNAILSQAEDEQDQAALKAGKLDMQALLDKKIAARDKAWEERYNELAAAKEESDKAIAGERSKLKSFQIKQFVINEALKNEFFHHTAVEDLAAMASGVWDLTDSGDLVARDKDGNIALGKTGRALTAKEWIEDLQKTRPHYFKIMAGTGSKPGASGSITMTRAAWQAEVAKSTPAQVQELFSKKAKGEIVVG
ncbi:hypothetical protein SBP02_11855 [Pseudomonas benzenivorans]|uniref:Phage protein n=1 Tax=Pseudomonas benzenivorans TaxID=556533 RepID=A0ABZ0PQQ1_9PSED|nr:hypothetical protein [Pseudomonas benzenivorans]WPC03479.1 hypothetical protein SBP02_11855 [Pseudomonas benzenivorans]